MVARKDTLDTLSGCPETQIMVSNNFLWQGHCRDTKNSPSFPGMLSSAKSTEERCTEVQFSLPPPPYNFRYERKEERETERKRKKERQTNRKKDLKARVLR